MFKSTERVPGFCLLTLLFGLVLRLLVGFFPYSGEAEPPRFGDYEAQRHWMELTVNLPIHDWYSASPGWWPLDYPPLSAYHEYIMGLISQSFDRDSVSIGDSMGFESETHRTFMRISVLLSELAVYVPAVYLVSCTMPEKRWRSLVFSAMIVHPGLIFVDHSHFQYNSVACGLVLFAVWLLQSSRCFSAAIAYTLSFMFKQTFLYYAPIFFAFMLGQALKLPTAQQAIKRVALLGFCVIGTMGIIIGPLVLHCTTGACVKEGILVMVMRIFPFNRGIFEDYVANAWIVFSPILRLRGGDPSYLGWIRSLSTFLTLLSSLLSGLPLLHDPSLELLPLGLAAGSFSFYLFSVMVHEKAIVLPLTFVLLSLPTLSKHHQTRGVAIRTTEAALLSMIPLMNTEKSLVGGFAVFGIAWAFLKFIRADGDKALSPSELLPMVFNIISSFAAVCLVLFDRPSRYPYLADLVIATGCFATFGVAWLNLTFILYSSVRNKNKLVA